MAFAPVRGPFSLANTTVFTGTGDYTIIDESILVVKKASGAATAVTLPVMAATGLGVGRIVTIKDGKGDAGSNNITISGAGADTIDSRSSLVLATNYASCELLWNGTEWNVLRLSSTDAQGNTTVQGGFAVVGATTLEGKVTADAVLTPTALSADVNDYAPTGLSTAFVLRLNPNGAARNVTGLTGGADGRLLLVQNIDTTATENLVLKNASASSAAANRFRGANGADITVRPGGSVLLCYDGTASLWAPVAI